MPLDAERLEVDYKQLQGTATATGIGGYSKHFIEPAILAFSDNGKVLHAYTMEIRIASPSPEINDIPSLLGRDIIDNWNVTINKKGNVFTAEVLDSDLQIPIGTGAQ
jgi:hypothetical protein